MQSFGAGVAWGAIDAGSGPFLLLGLGVGPLRLKVYNLASVYVRHTVNQDSFNLPRLIRSAIAARSTPRSFAAVA